MIIGCDISAYNDKPDYPEEINFKRMRSMGIEFVIIRCSVGVKEDSRYPINLAKAGDVGLITGSYHYLTWHDSIQSQLTTIIRIQNKYPSQIPVVLDIEERSGCPAKVISGKAIKLLLDGLKTELGITPGIYTNVSSWERMGYPYDDITQYWLWVAHWNVKTPVLPKPWQTWKIWQYTITNYAYMFGAQNQALDLDAYNGTVNDLKEWINEVS